MRPQEFGDQPLAEEQIDEIYLAQLENPVEHHLGQSAQAIADHHRQPGQRQLECDRSGSRQGGAAGGEGVVLFGRAQHHDRVSRPSRDRIGDGSRDGCDRRHDNAERADHVL